VVLSANSKDISNAVRAGQEEDRQIQRFFSPRSVAVIGAARREDKVGHVVFDNLSKTFTGKVYPINPNAEFIHGSVAYKSIDALPEPVDLALIVVPGKFVPQIMDDCGRAGIKAAIIISSGFKETGIAGARLEREIIDIAGKWSMRFIGPNCLGLINAVTGLNASFAGELPKAGHIAFISQSGALCTAILDWARGEEVGFSEFVSLGNKADIDETDLLKAGLNNRDTNVISMYIEGVADGRKFIDVAGLVSREKPVIAIKAGGTDAGARAVSSHTGTLAGSDNVYRAAFKQAGIVQAETLESLLDYARGFANQPPPVGNNLAIITNAGGPGIMATDACERLGLWPAQFSPKTIKILQNSLPPESNIYNPVDVLGDALANRYRAALEAVLADEGVDAILVILTPQAMTEITETAKAIGEAAAGSCKPVFTSFMGKDEVNKGVAILRADSIPNYSYPQRAIATIKAMSRWRSQTINQSKMVRFPVNKKLVEETFARAKLHGRRQLTDTQSSVILKAYGINVPKNLLAKDVDEAVEFAREIGYPVALKIASPDIIHKSDVGGIKLNVGSDDELRSEFQKILENTGRYMRQAVIWGVSINEMINNGREVIIGVNRNPTFGPLIMFGLGGIYVEILKDVSFRIAPLTRADAKAMLAEIKSYLLLRGIRGEAKSDIEAVIDTILRVSQLVTDFPEILEMDINPLMVLAAGRGCVAADVRISLRSD